MTNNTVKVLNGDLASEKEEYNYCTSAGNGTTFLINVD